MQAAPDVETVHVSDSAAQRRAEQRILELAGQVLRIELTHRPWSEARMTLPDGARVDVDGYCADPLVYAEVFARQGSLKSGQVHEVAQDVLKLITIRQYRDPTARLYLVFADDDAAAAVRGPGWLAEATRRWGVETLVVGLDPALRTELQQAQDRQRMVNPA